MEIHQGYKELHFHEPVITMGMFDGVHRGHRMLLDRVVREALISGSDSVAVTFEPHPRIVLSGDASHLRFLTDLEERIMLLRDTGLQHLVVIPFTRELSMMTADEFLKEVLCEHLGVRHLVAGFNHHFGRKNEGTSDTITECARRMGFRVTREAALIVGDVPVSSSLIREKISAGEIEKASLLLGYDYFLSGRVISGNRIGRNIGFPTANIEPLFRHKLIPGDGVYAVEVMIEGNDAKHIAMLNIGTRPTLNDVENLRTIEAHIIDFEGDLYGTLMSIRFRFRLRDEMRFENMDALTEQLVKDREQTISLLK